MTDVSNSLMINDDRDEEELGVLALPPLEVTDDSDGAQSPRDACPLPALPSTGGKI